MSALRLSKPHASKDVEGEEVCTLIEERGWTLTKALDYVGVKRATFHDWHRTDSTFHERYFRARYSQCFALADEALDIANENCVSMPDVQRNKLRVDTIKFMVAKLLPTVFGDRIQHQHTHRHAIVLLPPITPTTPAPVAVTESEHARISTWDSSDSITDGDGDGDNTPDSSQKNTAQNTSKNASNNARQNAGTLEAGPIPARSLKRGTTEAQVPPEIAALAEAETVVTHDPATT